MKKYILIFVLLVIAVILITAYVSRSGDTDNNSSLKTNDKDINDNSQDNNTDDHLTKADDAFKVVIDPGHGGKDKGATGIDDHFEKDFTLGLGKKVSNLLENEPEIEVFMTRDDDSFISQESRDRPKYANKLDADIFISLHQDTFEDPEVSGTESFYYEEGSRSFAEIMQKHVTEATGFRDRGVESKDLFVARDTEMPAVLIEVGYLSNPEDQGKMNTESFQKQIAGSIVDGIKEYQDN